MSGLIYHYHQDARLLNILDSRAGSHMLSLQCKEFMHEHIDDYIRLYDKTNQINALRISSYSTTNLNEVISADKLPALLHSNAGMARSILSLEHKRFEEFATSVRTDCNLKAFYIKFNRGSRFTISDEYDGHYTARIKVQDQDDLTVRSTYLNQLLIYMADGISLDLAARIFAAGRKECAGKLLNFASRLTLMSSILDVHFVPSHELYEPLRQS